jgi:hypothetical protein
MKTITVYQCGFYSGAGFPVRYAMTYSLAEALQKAKDDCAKGYKTHVFKVTVEEVKA